MGEFDAGFNFIALQITVVILILVAVAFLLGAWIF
jgi:hypothetical protein